MAESFAFETGDPRFQAGEPVMINGYRYVPADSLVIPDAPSDSLVLDLIDRGLGCMLYSECEEFLAALKADLAQRNIDQVPA